MVCPICNYRRAYSDKLAAHFETHTRPKFTCDLCDATFDTRNRMKDHMIHKHRTYKNLGSFKAWWTQFVNVSFTDCSVKEDMHKYELHLETVHKISIPKRLFSNQN